MSFWKKLFGIRDRKRVIEYIGPNHDRCALKAKVRDVTTTHTKDGPVTTVELKAGEFYNTIKFRIEERFIADFPPGSEINLVVESRR